MVLSEKFPERVDVFIKSAAKNGLRMIMVGGGAVNFHGFQRHSADVDFWIDISDENLEKLLLVLNEIGFQLNDLPETVKNGEQNISIKISPVFDLELITNFNPQKTFDEAFEKSILVERNDLSYFVLDYYDLIRSKIASERIKDKLDVEELQRINFNRKPRG